MSQEIEVGHIVGWGSDHIYGEGHYAEGRVVYRERDNLVILREDMVDKHPHINPFALRKVFHVWLVERKSTDGCDDAGVQ